MASTISTIKAQLLTDIKTTSVNNAYEGIAQGHDSTPPWAEVAFRSGDVYHDMTQVVDREYSMIVRVHGTSVEQIEVALEGLLVLYNSAASIAALRALGVVTIFQTRHYPPFSYTSTTQQPLYGDIDFTFTVRYT